MRKPIPTVMVGQMKPDGDVEYPTVTISGKPYTLPPAITRSIGGEQFVVLDLNPPPGFDVEAAIARLKGEPASAAVMEPAPVEVTPVDYESLDRRAALALAEGRGMHVTSSTTREAALQFLKGEGDGETE